MGKDTGFLDYKRTENENILPLERIENFYEFHNFLDDEKRREQAARCMNCGVPMCQSAIKLAGMVTGCPLHNYVPEWNDALYKGQYDMAAWRLLKTSSFPEFTGRICPALCEKACNCGNPVCGDGAVTIRDNELYIIEKAFESGYIKPEIPQIRSGKKIAVVGSGPAGLAVADWLNKRGHSVTVYEREDKAGGLLTFGIPNMKLDKKIVSRRVDLMKAEGVEFIFNADVGKSFSAKELIKNYDAVALCCGAKKPRPLLAKGTENLLPNENKNEIGNEKKTTEKNGLMFAVDFLTEATKSVMELTAAQDAFADLVITNKNIGLSLEKKGVFVEGKNVVVLGGGDTGNDCAGTCVRLGCKSVTQIEMTPCPPKERAKNNLWPQWPKILKTDYGAEESIAKFGKDPRVYETTIKEVFAKNGKVCGVKTVEVEFKTINGERRLTEREGTEKDLPADLILVAAGFLGCEDYTAKAFNLELSEKNVVVTDCKNEYQTSNEKIFTAGDMRRGQSLAVWAIFEGRECAKSIDEYLMKNNV